MAAQGQQEDIYNLSLSELMQVEVLSVSKKAENVMEAPQMVIVIDAEEIRRRGYTDLEQLLHDLPGFDISRGNGTEYSQIYQRGYRSNNTERTLLLIDGVEENDLWSNSAWISRQYPLSNVKRVEVIYGPASTVYGANAFLGVINVVTKNAEDLAGPGGGLGVSAQAGYGSWNTRYADLAATAALPEVKLTVTGRVFRSDEMDLSGYDDWDYDLGDLGLDHYMAELGTTDPAVARAAMRLDSAAYLGDPVLGGKAPSYSNQTDDMALNAKLEFENFTIGAQWFRRDEGYGAWYRDDYELGPAHGGRWVAQNSFLYTRYEKDLGEKLSFMNFTRFMVHQLPPECEEFYYVGYLNGGMGAQGNLLDEQGQLLPADQQAQPYWWHGYYNTFSQQLRTENRVVYSPSERLSLIAGSEIRRSHIQGLYLVSEQPFPDEVAYAPAVPGGNHFSSLDIGLFSQASLLLGQDLKLVLGGRFDRNRIRSNGGYGAVFNPKAALVATPGRFILKLIYSEAFMDASYWTKYGITPRRQLSNPTLQPEKARNLELNANWSPSESLYLDLAAYRARYDGAVGEVPATFTDEQGNLVETFQNQPVGEFTILGTHAQLNWQVGKLTFYANHSFTLPEAYEGGQTLRVGDIASHRANLGANFIPMSRLNLNLRANWVGERLTGQGTTVPSNPASRAEAYFLLHGSVSYQLAKGLRLQLNASNLLDTEHFHPGVRSADGDYYASLMPQNRFNMMFRVLADF